MGINLVDEDEKRKIKFLMLAINASRSSGKSIYATWLCYLDKGKDGHTDCMVEAFLA